MQPELFTTGVFIGDFILSRSPQRGLITEEENNNMYTEAIELIIWWRKREEAREKEAGLSFQQVYTQVS